MKNTLILLVLTSLLSFPFLLIKGITGKTTDLNGNAFFKESPTEAYDALTFLSAMNAFPNKDIPADGYTKAWLQHKKLLEAPKPYNTRNAWQNLGPNNIGGRTVSIAIDPQDTSVVWLGSASGGLWKSTSGGTGLNAWTYIPTGYPVLGVGSIAINPSNHNEMFIGTGETYAYGVSGNGLMDRTTRGSFGIGILKSTDGGQTWAMSLDWTYQQNRGVWDIQYNPFNTNVLYAATTEGVYKSADGGATWDSVLLKKMVTDLEVDPVDTNIVYAGVGNEGTPDPGIYMTSDGGANWSLLTGNGLPTAYNNDGRIIISLYPTNHHIVMALVGNEFSTQGIYRSQDGGQTWTLKSSQDIVSYQGWYAKGLMIKSNDSSKVIAGGVSLFKSTTSGSNFNGFGSVHSDIHDVISNPLDANKIYVITDGGLYRSNNFGTTFFDCNDGYVTSQHYIGSISATNPNLALSGLQDNSTIRYSGSVYWEGIIGGDGCYNAINQDNEDIEYGAYQYLNVYKTTDQWNSSFSQILTFPSDPLGGNPAGFLAPFILCPSNTNVLYAGTTTLWKTTNASFFTEVQTDPVDNGNYVLSIATSATNTDTVYFGTTPTDNYPMHVYRSDDGGFTKTDISSGLPNRYPRRITVNPGNSREVYVVFSGFGSGHIFKSEDGGTNWTDISTSLPDIPFHCLAIDPLYPNNIYAGSDFTVYASIDGGQSWSTFADALPEAVMVFDLVVSRFDHTLYAFTHGHGVYKADMLDIGVSVTDLAMVETNLYLYPNPATDHLSIEGMDCHAGPFSISLFDLKGKRVLFETSAAIHHDPLQLDISAIQDGSYLLVVDGGAWHETRKVVVVK